MTRNTKLYKLNADDQEIIYRDLTALELEYLGNIKNTAVRAEKAADACIVSGNATWAMKMEIGTNILSKSIDCVADDTMFEIVVSEYRKKVQNDFFLNSCKQILSIMPSITYTELTNMTYKDIIELLCLCESIAGKKLINVGDIALGKSKKGMSLLNFSDIPEEESNALKKQIQELNSKM